MIFKTIIVHFDDFVFLYIKGKKERMSVTPDLSRKVGMGVITPSPTPFLTPRPERRRIDWTPNRQDRDKEVNVQVLLRCRFVLFFNYYYYFLNPLKMNSSFWNEYDRPLSDEEQKSNVQKVISCNEQKKEVTVLQSVANKQIDRLFTFDKVTSFYLSLLFS